MNPGVGNAKIPPARRLDDIGFYTLSAARAARVAALYRLSDPLAFHMA